MTVTYPSKKLREFQEVYAEARKKHPHLPENCTDITDPRAEALIRFRWLEEWAVSSGFICDPRDVVMVSLTANICIFLPLCHALLFCYPSRKLGIAIVAFLSGVVLKRYVLMLHYSQHRRLFKHDIFRHFFPTVLAPFFGIPPGFYWLHHVVMHHIENNIFPFDLSSTETYRRDNFIHWLHYFGKYWCCMILLPYYAMKNGRFRTAVNSLLSLVLYTSLLFLAYQRWPLYTTYGWIIPLFVTGAALMFGNFSQHIFVDPVVAELSNKKTLEFNCALTYQCMNHPDNLATFNDGYHVTHHFNSRCHWTDMAIHFFKNIDKYVAAGGICFQDAHFFDIGIYVMTGQWGALAKRYIHFGPDKMSDEEVIAKLKGRLVPIHRTTTKAG